ncbi:ferric reduction oxidase 2-like isoform X2 [Vigna unguiculata]|uniref:ferric reduction oxidase 2-like isoform X2 n=1 Tax=Vigna unguiculata TaxID=3917 RepID=UPI0010170920|nr:ferric reduction oxidase 2-like isoform X2 [Vigna unguiculata]
MNVEVEKKTLSEEKYGRVESVIRWLVVVVFVGWIFVWIMTPTNTYQQKWKHRLQEKTESVFGAQGARLLVYTCPILFIAALGCVYVHIVKKGKGSNMEKRKKHEVSIWKRLVLVRGPLGIVSVTELAFLSMFIVLLLWSFSIYLHNGFAKITHKLAAEQGVKLWEKRLASAAVKLGLVGNICLAFLFFPVVRSSSVLPLLGLTQESCIKYHIWLGHIAMTLFTAHGILFIIYWALTHQLSKMLEWKRIGISNVSGEVSLVAGLLMWIAAIPRIRRKAFEVFFYTHYLYILFIVFFIFHVGFSYACTMLPAFYLFLVDRYLRFLQSRYQVPLISARVLPCKTLQLNFSKTHGLTYSPTSIMFINIPSISKLQWHPFTITSNSNLEPEVLSVVIKSEGTWSQKLYQMLSTPSAIDHLSVSVEGPYGPASTNYLRYDTLVMVSGGSGITPFISNIRELMYLNTAFICRTPKVILICAFKNSSYLSMLDLILPNSGTPFDISNMQLQIEAYITRKEEHELESQTHLQDIRFKPKATDAPISAILGPNSWLWLCAIISSSFIIFLVLIGIITRYIIFPVEYNSNKIFSQSLGSFLSMLAICVSITMAASVAVVWNKKHNDIEAKQIQNLEGSSSEVNVNGGDKEVESLPHQFLVQATKVHFDVRPDLRRMLMEVEGTRVGVFVSGPKKMKQEVAAICSSGLAENLHFESYSFSW